MMATTDIYEQAASRLDSLGLSVELLADESGQTDDGEHARWLISATDEEIRTWAGQMGDADQAWDQAVSEGLSYYWASRHVGGTIDFVGCDWSDGAITDDGDGEPICDYNGNTIASHSVEKLDRYNARHRDLVAEWWG
jgi:hypothetical protein